MIARRSLLIIFNNVVGAFLGFFALRFLARMPADALGWYTWAFSAVGVAMLFAAFGFPQAHVKRVSEGLDEATANGTYLVIKVVLTAFFVLLVLGGLFVYRFVLGRGFTDATTDAVIVIVTAAYALLSFRQIFDLTFQAHRHTARAESVVFVDTLFSVGSIAVSFYVYNRARGGWTPYDPLFQGILDRLGIQGPLPVEGAAILIATSYLIGRLVSTLYSGFLFWIHKYPVGRFSKEVFDSYKFLGLPLALVGGLTLFYANVDRLFLGWFFDGERVAHFQVPYTILTPTLFVATAVGSLLFPTLSKLDAEGDHAQMRDQVGRAERYLSMILLPQMVLAFVFAEQGINIFNAAYVEEANTLRLLIAYVFFSVLVTPARSLILGTGNPKFLLHLGVVNVIVVVGLNLILVPTLQEEGAAIVAGVGALVGYVYTKHRAARWTGPTYVPPGLPRQVVAALALGLLLWFAKQSLGPSEFNPMWRLIVVAILGMPVYLGFLVVLREFRRPDWDFLMDLLHPGKFAGYVSEELTGRQAKP